jgi:beta-galactosidase
MTRNLFAWAVALLIAIGNAGAAESPRQRTRIDDGWRFALGHAWDTAQDFDHGTRAFFFAKAGYGDGPAAADFDDRPWRRVDLPHDWAVELPFSERGSSHRPCLPGKQRRLVPA